MWLRCDGNEFPEYKRNKKTNSKEIHYKRIILTCEFIDVIQMCGNPKARHLEDVLALQLGRAVIFMFAILTDQSQLGVIVALTDPPESFHHIRTTANLCIASKTDRNFGVDIF